jgi:hypothetical protein
MTSGVYQIGRSSFPKFYFFAMSKMLLIFTRMTLILSHSGNCQLILIVIGTGIYPLKINLKVVPSPCLDFTCMFPL